MEYKHKAIDQYHFDELPEPTQEALYAAAAADKLNDIFAWLVGRDSPRGGRLDEKRKGACARVHVLGVILGRWTQEEAARRAGVNVRKIKAHQKAFCEVFSVEKKRNRPVGEKENGREAK